MKTGLLIALAVAITGQVLYHFTQKSVAPNAHPLVSLLAFYATASVLLLPLFFWFPLTKPFVEELGSLNWAVFAVGVSIILLELGFLLAYRAGGQLSSAFVLTSATTAITLLMLGLLFFRESVSASQLVGIALCLGGVALISRH